MERGKYGTEAPALEPPTIGSLASQLIEDGRNLVTAEIKLYKEEALTRVAGLKTAVILFVVAAVLALAALVTLLVALAAQVGNWLDSPGYGGLIVAGVTLVIAGLLGWIGAKKISGGAK